MELVTTDLFTYTDLRLLVLILVRVQVRMAHLLLVPIRLSFIPQLLGHAPSDLMDKRSPPAQEAQHLIMLALLLPLSLLLIK